MTPLELEIAIHYATKEVDYNNGDFSSQAVRDAIVFLDRVGMIQICNSLHNPLSVRKWSATGKLKFFVDHLCTIPLPVCSWSIPVDPGNFGLSEGRIAEARAIKKRNDEVVAGMIGNR